MPEPGLTEPRLWRARRVRASWSSVLLALAAAVVVILARDLFLAASQPIGWVAAAAAAALVLSPVIDLQARWIPRILAVFLTVVVGLLGIGSVGAGLFFEVNDQLGQLREQLPAAAVELEEGSGDGGVLAQLRLGSLVQDLVDQTTERISPESTLRDAFGTVPAFLVGGVLMLFFLAWGDDMFRGLQRQISDPDRRERMTRVATLAARLTQQYVVAAVATGMVVALVGGIIAELVALPTPLVLGVVLGAASVIPYIGVLFGGAPILLLSAASESAATTIVLAMAVVATQAAVTMVTRRVIERRTFRVGPAVIVVAALVGSDLYGLGGALVALLAGISAVAAIEAWGREQAVEADEVPGPEPERGDETESGDELKSGPGDEPAARATPTGTVDPES